MAEPISIVLAHGRAAQFEVPETERQLWAQALLFSLSRIGSEYAGRVRVEYAYFGDLWRRDTVGPRPHLQLTDGRTVTLTEGRDPRVRILPKAPKAALVGLGSKVVDAALPDLLLGPILRRAIPDVFDYLDDDDAIGAAVNARVVDACTKANARVIVGFSMGSIVGYDVLRTAGEDFPVRQFITCGSPIAMGPIHRGLRDRAGGDTPFPPRIRLWLNVWNDSDAATGIHGADLAGKFRDPEVDGRRRIQDAENLGRTAAPTSPFGAHDAIDYLSSTAMGAAIHAALLDLEPAG